MTQLETDRAADAFLMYASGQERPLRQLADYLSLLQIIPVAEPRLDAG